MKARFGWLLVWLALVCTSRGLAQIENTARSEHGPRYSITDLGHLDGGIASYANGINNRGEIVGSDYFSFENGRISAPVAFLYRHNKMVSLGSLGGFQSAAFAINERGQITGRAATSADPYGQTSGHVFLYDGAMHDLGTLGGGTATGLGINDSGLIVGVSTVNSTFGHAFLYDGDMHDLGAPDGMTDSQANGINDKGQIVGVSYNRNTIPYNFQAFLYDGAFHLLGTLGGPTSLAAAINNEGVVVGESQISSGAPQHAFLYDGSMHDLGAFNDGTTNAKAINNHGQVVGQWDYTVGHTQIGGAFLYDHGTLYDLKKLLDSSGEGWIYLIEATSINKRGQIVGAGVMHDGVHAFRMDPKVRCNEDDERDRCHEDDKTDRCHEDDKADRCHEDNKKE